MIEPWQKTLRDAFEPHVEEAARIVQGGDVCIVLGDAYGAGACPLIERLLGSERGPVVRVTRARARSLVEPGDPEDLGDFLTKDGWSTLKVLVVTTAGYYCLNFVTNGGKASFRVVRTTEGGVGP